MLTYYREVGLRHGGRVREHQPAEICGISRARDREGSGEGVGRRERPAAIEVERELRLGRGLRRVAVGGGVGGLGSGGTLQAQLAPARELTQCCDLGRG